MTVSQGAIANPHVVIAGHGRSGSNLILDLYDAHEATHCRNEANMVTGSALCGLPGFFPEDNGPDFADRWPAAIDTAAVCSGSRDRITAGGKSFRRSGPAARAMAWTYGKRGFRKRFLANEHEWPCPAPWYDRAALTRATPVFKLLRAPSGLAVAHTLDPRQRMIHMIREPAAFLQSWFNRLVKNAEGGPEGVWRFNMIDMPRLAAHYDAPPDSCATYSIAALLESELWRWRFLNETLVAVAPSPRYLAVSYAQATGDRLQTAAALYAHAGLDFTSAHEAKLADHKNTLFASPHGEVLDRKDIDLAISRALKGFVPPPGLTSI